MSNDNGADDEVMIINSTQTKINIKHIMSNINGAFAKNDDDVFEYTGKGCVVPKDVKIVRFHPSVIEVEDRAFSNCNNLREVVFNERLQKIGASAFYYCPSLSSITLPSTVIEIGHHAFSACSNLSEAILNEGLKKIGGCAFYKCKSLESITIPSSVTEIRREAFRNCNNLREVLLNEGLQSIGASAFSNCKSSSITIPSTVTEVSGAFQSCNNLREVVLHGVPREIAKNAFYNCTLLERFTFPTISTRLDNLIQTGHWDEIKNEVDEVHVVVQRSGGELFVSAQAMGGGNNWIRVRESLGRIIRLISRYELKEATSLFELALWKFKLDQVDKANPIPRKKCRMDAPGPVKDIILQYLPYDISAEVVFEYTGEGCVVPKDVTIVQFHPSVIEVENEAFQHCSKMIEVVFNDDLQKIGRSAFYCGTSLSSIILPSTVTEICRSAFYNCYNLREVVLNDGLQKIGEVAFYGCTSLSSITLPSAVTEIGNYAFNRCSNLRAVVFHGVPREIGNGAFHNCTSLERFTFPIISTRLDALIQTGHWDDIENEIHEGRGVVEWSGGDLFVSTQTMGTGGGRNWNRVRESLDRIVRLISYYELKEGTSMLELALWKFKLDQVDQANPNAHGKRQDCVPEPVKDTICRILCSLFCCSKECRQVEETNRAVRDLCRMDVPGPVKNTILEYLS